MAANSAVEKFNHFEAAQTKCDTYLIRRRFPKKCAANCTPTYLLGAHMLVKAKSYLLRDVVANPLQSSQVVAR